MTPTEEQRILNQGKEYQLSLPSGKREHFIGYIDGATAENKHISEKVKESYKAGWRDGYDDFKSNDLKEHIAQELTDYKARLKNAIAGRNDYFILLDIIDTV